MDNEIVTRVFEYRGRTVTHSHVRKDKNDPNSRNRNLTDKQKELRNIINNIFADSAIILESHLKDKYGLEIDYDDFSNSKKVYHHIKRKREMIKFINRQDNETVQEISNFITINKL